VCVCVCVCVYVCDSHTLIQLFRVTFVFELLGKDPSRALCVGLELESVWELVLVQRESCLQVVLDHLVTLLDGGQDGRVHGLDLRGLVGGQSGLLEGGRRKKNNDTAQQHTGNTCISHQEEGMTWGKFHYRPTCETVVDKCVTDGHTTHILQKQQLNKHSTAHRQQNMGAFMCICQTASDVSNCGVCLFVCLFV
jgi:hypothetical protein